VLGGYTGGTVLSAGTLSISGTNTLSASTTPAPQAPQIQFIQVDQTGHPLGGIPIDYRPNYDEGYGNGYTAGYSSGYVSGQQSGTSAGTANGTSDGYHKGWGEAYQPAYDVAYNTQLPVGEAAGFAKGILDGYREGYTWAYSVTNAMIETYYAGSYSGGTYISAGTLSMKLSNFSGGNLVSISDLPAFYNNLGYDDGKSAGNSAGSKDGYAETYPATYAAAFPIGYENGTVEGTAQGTADGNSDGYTDGWDLGYAPGFGEGWDAGVDQRFAEMRRFFQPIQLKTAMAGDSAVPLYPVISVAPFLLSGDDTTGFESGVPEPATTTLFFVALGAGALVRARRNSGNRLSLFA